MKVRFTVITRQDVINFDLDEGTVILGRDRACDYPLKDPTLERRHLALTHDGSRVTATDLQTRAGTLVNGSPIERAVLHDGDRIQIGECRIIAAAAPGMDSRHSSTFTSPSANKKRPRKHPLIRDDERFFIRIAKEWGLLNRARMRAILFVKSNNRLMGDERRVEEICFRKDYLTVTQVREIIAIWERMVVRCRSCHSVFTPRDLNRTRRLICPNCSAPLRRTLDFPGDGEEQILFSSPAQEEGRALAVGEMFGGCRVDRFLAEGGSAEVYEGTHIALNKKVAIKVLKKVHAATWDHAHRFVEEARRVARLDHPHIVQVFNVGFEKNRYFIVYQFVEGRTLAELLSRYGSLPTDRARYITAATAAGLHEAHRHGIIHRDVKPENILVGRNRVVKVTDFGIAKDLHSSSPANTEPGMGTYLYLSPEQEGEGVIDQRCDIYSLGLVLRYMLLGQRPPEGHRYVDIPSPHEVDPVISRSMSDVVVKMLARNPEDRYASMMEVIEALREAELEDERPVPETPAVFPAAASTYRRTLMRAAAVLVLFGVAALGGAMLMKPQERDEWVARSLQWLRISAPAALPQEAVSAVPIAAEPLNPPPPVVVPQVPQVPIYTPPEALKAELDAAFEKRDFAAICAIAEQNLSSVEPGRPHYCQRVLKYAEPLRKMRRVNADAEKESFVAGRGVTQAEYQHFLPQAYTLVNKQKPGFFTTYMMNERYKDVSNTKPNDVFPYASFYEAAAYCDWLTSENKNPVAPFTYRLPKSDETQFLTPPESAFWLGDSSVDNRFGIVTKSGLRLEADPNYQMHQPAILPVADVKVAHLALIKRILDGYDDPAK